MKIAFVWQGSSDEHTFSHWNDGLRAAMKLIEETHEVTYHEPWDDIEADFILYWEAPCTANGTNAPHYNKVRNSPIKKALLFAGGPIEVQNISGFDWFFTESQINDEEFEKLGVPYTRAFGINEDIFKPLNLEKKWDGIHHGTCASWKRQWLVGQALGDRGLLVGRRQKTDRRGFDESENLGTTVLDEQPYEEVNRLINQSKTLLQTSDFWGGGQRATLEAMACGVPPIVMTDSPKNREYVEESGFGVVCEPDPVKIREAVEAIESDPKKGIGYVQSRWTSRHYAYNLLKGIEQCLNS